MEYLSSFRLTSEKHFPPLLLYCSIKVDLENNGTSHQFIFKHVLCKAFSITYTTAYRLHTRRSADYIDDRVTITSLVLTLAWRVLECSTNKVYCGTKVLSHPRRPYKLARSRSPCARKSWRFSVLVSRVVSTELFSPVLYVSRKVKFIARKPYRHNTNVLNS